jgi:uncharacterized damage-inducible protein DinB
MKRSTGVASLLVLLVAGAAQAQQPKAQKSSQKSSGFMATQGVTKVYEMSKDNILKTADQLSEEKYAFRATDKVRTAGQILGHIADAQNYLCGVLGGTNKEYAVAAEKLEGKAAISSALKQSFDNCDAVTSKLTDADLTRQVSFFGQDVPLSNVLAFLGAHNWEHYGNLVTYMRLNSIVPPSSQGGGM